MTQATELGEHCGLATAVPPGLSVLHLTQQQRPVLLDHATTTSEHLQLSTLHIALDGVHGTTEIHPQPV